MRFNGLRKYYFEKKIKENQFCSDKKINRLSVKQITQSDIKKSAFNDHKSSKNNKLNFNGQINELNIKKNLFSNTNEKENYCPNENTNESKISKDTQENTLKNDDNSNNNDSKNIYLNNNKRLSRYERLKLRLSMPIYTDNNYYSNNVEIKKENNNININKNNIQ